MRSLQASVKAAQQTSGEATTAILLGVIAIMVLALGAIVLVMLARSRYGEGREPPGRLSREGLLMQLLLETRRPTGRNLLRTGADSSDLDRLEARLSEIADTTKRIERQSVTPDRVVWTVLATIVAIGGVVAAIAAVVRALG